MHSQPLRGVGDLPSLPIQTLKSHLVLQEDTKDVQDTNPAQIHRTFKTPLPVSGGGGCAGGTGYSQSVYCWSWANSVGLSEIHPPSLIFGQQGPKAGATSCCAPRARLGAEGPGRPLGHIGTMRGTGGSRPAGTIPLSLWAANPGSSEQPVSTFLPRAGMEREEEVSGGLAGWGGERKEERRAPRRVTIPVGALCHGGATRTGRSLTEARQMPQAGQGALSPYSPFPPPPILQGTPA